MFFLGGSQPTAVQGSGSQGRTPFREGPEPVRAVHEQNHLHPKLDASSGPSASEPQVGWQKLSGVHTTQTHLSLPTPASSPLLNKCSSLIKLSSLHLPLEHPVGAPFTHPQHQAPLHISCLASSCYKEKGDG